MDPYLHTAIAVVCLWIAYKIGRAASSRAWNRAFDVNRIVWFTQGFFACAKEFDIPKEKLEQFEGKIFEIIEEGED